MATVHQYGPPSSDNSSGRRVMYVKGAPDRLFPLCNSQLADDSLETITGTQGNAPFTEGMWLQAQEQMSSQGLRVLALCRCVSAPGACSASRSAVICTCSFRLMVLEWLALLHHLYLSFYWLACWGAWLCGRLFV